MSNPRRKSNLRRNISLILSGLDLSQQIYAWRRPQPDMNPDRSLVEPGWVEVAHEGIIQLKILYSQATPNERLLFPGHLVSAITNSNAEVIVHALKEVDGLALLRPVLRSTKLSEEGRNRVWAALWTKLMHEHYRFTDGDLDLIEDLVDEEHKQKYPKKVGSPPGSADVQIPVSRALKQLVTVLDNVRRVRLKKHLLEGHNPEINTDKRALVSRMHNLGFRKEIAEALEKVEGQVLAAGTPLDFKGCMDLIRTVYEEMFEDAAKAAAKKVTRPLPHGSHVGPFQPWYQYLEGAGCLTADEAAVAQKLYNYLSNAGTHQLGAAPEQVRVSKNIVIEFGLMIVGRVEALP